MEKACKKCGSADGLRLKRGSVGGVGIALFLILFLISFAGTMFLPFLMPLWFIVGITSLACLLIFRKKAVVCESCGAESSN